MEEFSAALVLVTSSYSTPSASAPTVNIQTEFRAPIVYGDEIDIEVFVSRPGRSSAIFQYRVTRVSDGQLCAQSTKVYVAVNLDSRRPVPLPEKFREASTPGLPIVPCASADVTVRSTYIALTLVHRLEVESEIWITRPKSVLD